MKRYCVLFIFVLIGLFAIQSQTAHAQWGEPGTVDGSGGTITGGNAWGSYATPQPTTYVSARPTAVPQATRQTYHEELVEWWANNNPTPAPTVVPAIPTVAVVIPTYNQPVVSPPAPVQLMPERAVPANTGSCICVSQFAIDAGNRNITRNCYQPLPGDTSLCTPDGWVQR